MRNLSFNIHYYVMRRLKQRRNGSSGMVSRNLYSQQVRTESWLSIQLNTGPRPPRLASVRGLQPFGWTVDLGLSAVRYGHSLGLSTIRNGDILGLSDFRTVDGLDSQAVWTGGSLDSQLSGVVIVWDSPTSGVSSGILNRPDWDLHFESCA